MSQRSGREKAIHYLEAFAGKPLGYSVARLGLHTGLNPESTRKLLAELGARREDDGQQLLLTRDGRVVIRPNPVLSTRVGHSYQDCPNRFDRPGHTTSPARRPLFLKRGEKV